jgi:hypothetical protein
LQSISLELVIAISGIIIPVVVAILIFWRQKVTQDKISLIIERMDNTRATHIKWMADHVLTLLKSLRKNYTDLIERVEIYKNERTEQNLKRVTSLAHVAVTMSLTHLYDIADRDIGFARDYINNTWLAVKFMDAIPLLGWGIHIEDQNMEFMDPQGLNEYANNIQDKINEIDSYIEMIEEELKTVS